VCILKSYSNLKLKLRKPQNKKNKLEEGKSQRSRESIQRVSIAYEDSTNYKNEGRGKRSCCLRKNAI